MVKSGAIKLGDKIDVCVPTGNFGNIFACYLAKKMGLPVEKLICASNKNNVLTDFFESGVYDRNRAFHTTMSPSMDILISSNLERLLYITLGSDKTAKYMSELSSCGKYALSAEDFSLIKADFIGIYTDEDETAVTIKKLYDEKNCLIDTHTAVAMAATHKYVNINKAERRILTVSTASAYKFATDVYTSLTGERLDDLDALGMLNKLTGVEIPEPLAGIADRAVIFNESISKDDMDDSVRAFAKE